MWIRDAWGRRDGKGSEQRVDLCGGRQGLRRRKWVKVARDDLGETPEFVHIAAEQQPRENAAARQANRVLICNTNAFATTLWHRRYVGTDSPEVKAIAAQGRCDLYLLTGDEIPFVQGGLCDGIGQ